MSLNYRIILIIGAIVAFVFVFRKLKKTEMSIANSVFWLFFAASLVVAALVPQVVFFLSTLTGFESPSNFVFLYVIAMLLIKCFTLTVEVSTMGERIDVLAQEIALRDKERHDRYNPRDGSSR